MAIYVTRWFARWANQQGLSNGALCRAAHEMAKGLYEASLCGHLLKKRIARPGGGKSGGFRALVATDFGSLWFVLYGFAKNDLEDVEPVDIEGYRIWANELVELPLHKLLDLQERGSIKRIDYDA